MGRAANVAHVWVVSLNSRLPGRLQIMSLVSHEIRTASEKRAFFTS